MAQLGDISTIIDVPLAIEMFNSGKSVKAIADHFGCSRTVIQHRFRKAGITVRNRSEGMYARMAETSIEDRRKLVNGANNGMRNSSFQDRMRRLCLSAIGKQRSLSEVGILEEFVAEKLAFFDPIMQLAFGPYNIDIAIGSVAIEIHSCSSHPHSRINHRQRLKNLLKAGYTVVYVKPSKKTIINDAAINQLISVCEFARSNKAIRGKYWVIRGTGEGIAIGTLDGNDLSVVETPISLLDYTLINSR